MAIKACVECGEMVSEDAKACPHCGKKDPTETIGDKIGQFITSVIFFTIIMWWSPWESTDKSTDTLIEGTLNMEDNVKDISKPKEKIMQVDVRDILSAYKNNEIGADNKYKDKLIQVNGLVANVKKDILGNLYVTLGTGSKFESPKIQAFFDDSMSKQLGILQKGEQLTVVCRVDGLMMNVIVKECIIK